MAIRALTRRRPNPEGSRLTQDVVKPGGLRLQGKKSGPDGLHGRSRKVRVALHTFDRVRQSASPFPPYV